MGDSKLNVLVVDTDPGVRERFLQCFARAGFNAHEADTAAEAYRLLGQHDLDAVVIDLESLGRESLGLIRVARERRHPAEVIVLTGPTTVSRAIEAMKLGVFDDLLVPVDLDALIQRIRAAGRLRRDNPGKRKTADANKDEKTGVSKERNRTFYHRLNRPQGEKSDSGQTR